MKYIKQITLTNNKGESLLDSSPDIANQKIELTTLHLTRRLLDQQQYKTLAEMKQASKIIEFIEVKKGLIALEDADYDFLMKLAPKFTPYLIGTKIKPYYDALENPVTKDGKGKD